MPSNSLVFLASLSFYLTAVPSIRALDNGLGLTPAMGYSTWNDCSSFRDSPTSDCWDPEAHVKNVTLYLINSGLAKLGYRQINIDEGWLQGRYSNGTIYENMELFPSGMKGLGDWVHAQETYPGSGTFMKYGLYSCRGTCQCSTGTYQGPGSHGYEAMDTNWMVNAGADYLKIDSCCGSQDHATAFSDYAKFRDAMNATGKPVFFSLCGWEEWYAPPDPSVNYTGGYSLGNSWRIAGDGDSWAALTNCMNVISHVYNNSSPGGFSDPDLLIGPEVQVGGQTDQQARAQFTMWSIFPANLLISQNVLAWSDYALETYSNSELIAINQDYPASPAFRIVGNDLPFPCSSAPTAIASVIAVPCNSNDPTQVWTYDSSTGIITPTLYANVSGVLDDTECVTNDGNPVNIYPKDNGQGTCNGKNQQWTWNSSTGTIVNAFSNTCLDVYDFAGPQVDIWGCNGGVNQNFTRTSFGGIATAASSQYPSLCLAARAVAPQQCTNVWGRTLSTNEYVLGFVNNDAMAANITCDANCFAALNIPSSVNTLVVRDLWLHQDIAKITTPFSFSAVVNGTGFAAAFKLTPA